MDVPWRIALFGGLRAEHGDQAVTRFRTRKTGALLAYLAYYSQRTHLRDQLIELCWPECTVAAGRNNLSRELSGLRQQLEPPGVPPGAVIVADRTAVRLNPEAVTTDVAAFEAALRTAERTSSPTERARHLAEAMEAYGGELLPGFYESWVLGQREWLAETYFQALGRLVTLLEQAGDLSRALEYARQGVLADPLREEGRRDLMRLLAAAGQPEAALRQYQELERLLKEELDAQPSARTRALARQIEADPTALLAPPRVSLPQAPEPSPQPSPIGEAASGTRTFLLTDVEGSTALWEEHPQAMAAALARHDALAASLVAQHAGTLVKHRGEGDSLFAVFSGAGDGVSAALALQRALWAERWPEGIALRVRMALHTGDAVAQDGDYLGAAVNRCARLRAAAHGGQVLLSRATQELVADHFPEGVSLRDLGECRLKDLVRPERVFQLQHAELPGDFPPLRSLATRPNNLPAQATPLIGREVEQEAVRRLLRREEVRLVALTGPGGTGKTRLGLQVAADLLDEFADGVFFVDVAPIRDPELVVPTIAQALGVREVEGRPLGERLKEYLREKQLLLLLDNFEQIVAAAQLVAELLSGAPRLKVLVTSRAVLRLRGEHDFPVPPLALPDRRHLPGRELLSQYAAVALFIQRAVAAQPEFAVTNENAPAVAEICHRLDGLPLAIELAAARARLLTPEALLSRLGRRLPLLTGGARDLPERQQTLRAAIGWSCDLLAEGEQRLFRRLSVFVGGCSLEAAEAVCRAEGDPPIDLLEGIGSLVEQSLLRQQEPGEGVGTGEPVFGRAADSERGGGRPSSRSPGLVGARSATASEPGQAWEPRFGMLETIREFGRERLAASGEEELIRRQHALFFLTLAEQQDARDAGWELLDREYDNLRAALEWWGEQEDGTVALRLAGAMTNPWLGRGRLTEGRQHLARVLSRENTQEPTAARARALNLAGMLAGASGDYLLEQQIHQECLAIWRRLGDKDRIAGSLLHLAYAARHMCDDARARTLFEESVVVAQETGDKSVLAYVLVFGGHIVVAQGDHGVARSYLERGLALSQELGSKLYAAMAHGALALVERAQGNFVSAGTRLRESLALHWASGFHRFIPNVLISIAGLAAVQGQGERAARLFGAAETVCKTMEVHFPVGEREEYERDVAVARSGLGETEFAAAWAEGRAMPLAQAVAFALEETQVTPAGGSRQHDPPG
jgi:predicted ATPase/DNA-binding SARP family transcriptional activator